MTSHLPPELKRGPFFVDEARRAGLTWDRLQTAWWTRLSRGQYAWTRLKPDDHLRLSAVKDRLPPEYAFSGRTAAWLLGLDVPARVAIEVTIPREVPIRRRAGLTLRRSALPASEVITLNGFRLTSALRTIRDLGSGANLVESVVAIDMGLHAGLVRFADLTAYIEEHAGAKGIKRLRRATRLSDERSESPMETRLRMALVTAGLPRPSVQAELHDATGGFLARVDLYYPDRGLVVEYDGSGHRDRLVSDLRRQNALVHAGYHLLRYTADDLRTPESVAGDVRRMRNRLARRAA